MKTSHINVKDPDAFCRLLAMRGPLVPRVLSFAWEGEEGRILFDSAREFFPEEAILAAWAHFGFYYSRNRRPAVEALPDLHAPFGGDPVDLATGKAPKEGIRRASERPDPVDGPKGPPAWMETFPPAWEDLLTGPLHVLIDGQRFKGHSAAARFFLHRLTIRGRRVLRVDFSFFSDSPGAGWRALERGLEPGAGIQVLILEHAGRCDSPTFQRLLNFLLLAPDRGLEVISTQWPGKPLEGYRTLPLPEQTLPQLLKSIYLPAMTASSAIRLIEEAGRPSGLLPGEVLSRLSPRPRARYQGLSTDALLGLKVLAASGGSLPVPQISRPVLKEFQERGIVREQDGMLLPAVEDPPGPLTAAESGALQKRLGFSELPQMFRLYAERLTRSGPPPNSIVHRLEQAAREGDLFTLHDLACLQDDPVPWAPYISGWEGDVERFIPLFMERPDEPGLQLLAFLFEWEHLAEGQLEGKLPEGFLHLLKARDFKRDGPLDTALDLMRSAASGPGPQSTLASLILADALAENGMREEATTLLNRCKEGLTRQPLIVQAYYSRYLSYFYFTIGRLADARAACERWMNLAVERGWLWQEALAYNDLGVICNEMGDLVCARRAFAAAARFAHVLGEAKRLNLIHFNLGEVILQEGGLGEAEEIFTRTAEANRGRQDNRSLFFDLIQLARIHYLRGQHALARKRVEELDKLYSGLPVHPWAGKLLLLKAELAKWGDPDDYRKALKALKGFAFPIAQDKAESARLVSQGILRKAVQGTPVSDPLIKAEKEIHRLKWKTPPLEMEGLSNLILLLEWDRYYPGQVPERILALAFEKLRAGEAGAWEQVLKPRVDVSILGFFAFLSKPDFDSRESPIPFEITLPGGHVHSHGEIENDISIELPNGTLLRIPAEASGMMPADFWIIWGLSLQTRAAAHLKVRPDVLTLASPQVFHGFVYACPKSAQTVWQVQKFARTAIPILLTGETGCGKEVLAEAIHQTSARRAGPFIPVNCASIPESLFEAELFGWRKGAFTGALLDKPGIVETAHGGTLFLDEVGELPPPMQAKLLRVLSDRKVQRLGETFAREVDFRLVTATNRNLKERVREGAFREDLYFRIAVGVVEVPPLRERREDIPFIARVLVEKNRGLFDLPHVDLHPLFLSYLMEQEWPGNVRELENFLLGCLVHVQKGEPLSLEHAPAPRRESPGEIHLAGNYQELIREFRRKIITQALNRTEWDRGKAAALLGITPQALGYQIRELHILKS